jgi:murein DD-endopeptidase MepM/ murein hydrolase activator NlpD
MNLKATSRLVCCIIWGLLQSGWLQSQDKQGSKYPQDFFGSPLDIPLNLSGNFGELRTNHFHAGLDIKTNQQEGLNLYAVADGYVSRIKISPFDVDDFFQHRFFSKLFDEI